MTLLITLAIVYWIIRSMLFSESRASIEARERFVYNFIYQYSEQTGEVLTYDQALGLIRAVATHDRIDNQSKTAKSREYTNAIIVAKRLCAEAERNVLK